MTEPEFDVAEMFDEDYLYADGDAETDADVERVWRMLQLQPGQDVLDLCCGYGRIANRVAQRGCRVVGLDVTPLFLDRARKDAAELGIDVEYVQGDMRELPWTDRFDAAYNWMNSYGYFTDDDNRRVLREVYRVLRPGGRFVLDLNNYTGQLPRREHQVHDLDDGVLIERLHLDPLTGRYVVRRTIARDGRPVRRFTYTVRAFTFPELRDWLQAAGFATVDGYGLESEPLTVESRGMIVVAHKPE